MGSNDNAHREPTETLGEFGPKIFAIGFHKTGTTSLADALELLGYKVCGGIGLRDPKIAERALDLAKTNLPRFDAFQNNPWAILYRELDKLCPGSRFILTERSTDRWLASADEHFGQDDTPMREWIYGVGHPRGNEEIYRARFDAHYREVREYFADRPDDLLTLDVSRGGGWTQLCDFLGYEVPDVPFPHRNVKDRHARRRLMRRSRGRLDAIGRTLSALVRPGSDH